MINFNNKVFKSDSSTDNGEVDVSGNLDMRMDIW